MSEEFETSNRTKTNEHDREGIHGREHTDDVVAGSMQEKNIELN